MIGSVPESAFFMMYNKPKSRFALTMLRNAKSLMNKVYKMN